MIRNKEDLKAYMTADMAFYAQYTKRDRFIAMLTQDPIYLIRKYVKYLRKEEYFCNTGKSPLGKLCFLYYFRKKNVLGNKLGFKIPKNCFGPGLSIYHHGCIIVNEAARIGGNCRLHGNNCIGNNGKTDAAPKIGDNLDLGFGASIIGGIELGCGAIIGANAVVVHDVEPGAVMGGVPARRIK